MNKNILIITPFFPPQTHAAVFRAFKLVKYLKRTGWNPIVLTVNRNYLYLAYIIHSGFISGYQNRYGDNLKPPTNVYHRMTA